jgi:hypothetical protein
MKRDCITRTKPRKEISALTILRREISRLQSAKHLKLPRMERLPLCNNGGLDNHPLHCSSSSETSFSLSETDILNDIRFLRIKKQAIACSTGFKGDLRRNFLTL